ncbi:MAG: 16S rRNA (adenine(1518)-N(6)/adenine(1519)-N(6))-dimethyltransferase RsmA [Syntrophorhabdales bacterium]
MKKSLGQHLLKDKNLLAKMVRLAGITQEDVVVEIGPGHGDLTRSIAAKGCPVHAIELDERFREILGGLEQEFPNIKVVFSDVMAVRLADMGRGRRITAMGNIPYYLTGEILFKLLYEKAALKGAYLTVQREVAQRIVSPSHSRSYGALSVIFQLYASVRLLFTVKAALFIPPPKVESAFISIVFHDTGEADGGLVAFVKQCFRYKRKYLRHSLSGLFAEREIDDLYRHMGFSASTRAEEIEPEGFREMHRFLAGAGKT